ncbi:MAG: SPASM domain-containing protein, partial [Acidobacteriota bacterium]|nr:SPASM domain-containing protein [Acidobacteriota bacterium]
LLPELRTAGLVVKLEECFPGANLQYDSGSLGCRQAYGSCYVDNHGEIKPCRLSQKVLGRAGQQPLQDIWRDYIYSDYPCCQITPTAGQAEKLLAGAVPLSTVNLDSSLKPVALFSLKKKDWGALLIRNLNGLVLSQKGEHLVRLINGQNSLSFIKKRAGSRAVSFIYALFLKGLIRLEK